MVRLGMITNKIDYKVYSNKPFAIWANSRIINERLSANSYNRDYLDFAKAKNTFNFKKVSDIAKVTAMIGWKGLTTDDYVDEDGVYLLRTVDIKDNYIDLENAVMAKREKVYEQPQIILKQGDIIFSKDGTLGITAIVPRHQNKEMCVGSTLARIRLNSNLDNYYVCIAFMSKIVQAQIGYFTSGIAQPHITQEYINKLEIPIPSPEIQKYIGDKVRKAEELREEAKRLKKEAEEIFFNEINIVSIDNAFKKEQHIKFNWINIDELDVNRIDAEYNRRKYTILVKLLIDNNITLIPISNLLEEPIVSGSTPKGGNYIENGIPFVRATNLCEYSIDDNLVYISKEESDKLKNSEIRSGDVVFSIAGSIGVASIIPSYIEKANINQALVRLRLNNINKYYFVFVVNSSIGRLLSLRLANGAVQLNLNREEVGNIMVPRINDNKEEIIANKIKLYIELLYQSKQLIQEAKRDVEDLIEGNFDMSKVKANS